MLSCKVGFNDMLQNPETRVTSWMRIFKIDGDPKRIWVQAAIKWIAAAGMSRTTLNCQQNPQALAAHNYRVVVRRLPPH